MLRSFCDLLGCGGYYPRSNRNEANFTKFSDKEKIIPFFKKYPIIGVKSLDYSDFCKVVDIIRVKKHLTQKGLAEIEKIKSGMNTKRVS